MNEKEDDSIPVAAKEYMDFTKEIYYLHYLLSYFISIDARNMFFNFSCPGFSQAILRSYHNEQIQKEIEGLFDFLSSEFRIGRSVMMVIGRGVQDDDDALYVAWPILGTKIYLVAMRALSGEMKMSLMKDKKKLREFFSPEKIGKLQKIGETTKRKVVKIVLKPINLKGFADLYDYVLKNGFFEF